MVSLCNSFFPWGLCVAEDRAIQRLGNPPLLRTISKSCLISCVTAVGLRPGVLRASLVYGFPHSHRISSWSRYRGCGWGKAGRARLCHQSPLEDAGRWHDLDEPSCGLLFCWGTNLLLSWPGTECCRLNSEAFFQYV